MNEKKLTICYARIFDLELEYYFLTLLKIIYGYSNNNTNNNNECLQ